MATITRFTSDASEVAALVSAAQAGDQNAFDQLVERYKRAVFATVICPLGNYAEAQELCQDVFIQALQKLHQLKNPMCFGGWLRSITHRMAISRAARRRAGVPTDPKILAGTCVERATPLTFVLDGERRSQVHAGLARLRAIDRNTLMAFYVRGKTLLQMSDEFEAPIGTIKRRLHVARKRLAKEVEDLVAV